jgi:hydroxypyruvate reductase
LSRAKAARLDARNFLPHHDSYSFFDPLGDLVRTGPTLTNVNDIRAIPDHLTTAIGAAQLLG